MTKVSNTVSLRQTEPEPQEPAMRKTDIRMIMFEPGQLSELDELAKAEDRSVNSLVRRATAYLLEHPDVVLHGAKAKEPTVKRKGSKP